MPGNDEIIQLILKTQGVEGLRSLASEAEKAAGSLDKAGKSGVNMGQSLLQGGRAIQDFAQGGIGGILNNIEGVAAALGLGAGVAGAATVAGVAIALAGPPILNFFKSLGTSEPELKSIKGGIEAVTTALDALADKTKRSNKETAEFNKLAAEQGTLEKEAAARKAERAAFAAQPAGPDLDKDIGNRVTAALVPNQARAAAAAAGTFSGEATFGKKYPVNARFDAPALNDLAEKAVQGDMAAADKLHSVLGLTQSDYLNLLQRAKLRLGSRAKANQLVTGAMGGDVGAARDLIAALPPSEMRDNLVRATISNRTRDEGRFAAGQFLDNTIGRATRGLRDRNAATKQARDLRDNTREIAQQLDEAKAAADAEQKRADAETMRLREQTRHEQERQQAEAAKKAQAARLDQFQDRVQGVAQQAGVPLSHDEVLQAAQEASAAAAAGVNTDEALAEGIRNTIEQSQRTQAQYAQLAAQIRRMMQQNQNMPVMSDTGF